VFVHKSQPGEPGEWGNLQAVTRGSAPLDRDKLDGVGKERCPECGAVEVVPIVYGYPAADSELMRAAQAGEVVLGGCVIEDDQPYWRCRNCGSEGTNSPTPG
jgi:hypothetical protein